MRSTSTTEVIEVSGVHWASSKAVTEAVLSRRPGVLAVEANPVSQTAPVSYDPNVMSVVALAGWVRDCGYHCAGQSVPDHVCHPMTEPGPPLSARIKIQRAAESLDSGTHEAGVDDFFRAGDVDPRQVGDADGHDRSHGGAGQRTAQDAMGHGGHHRGMSMDAMVRGIRNRFVVAAVLSVPVL